jgi:hypothetical protein
MRVLLEKRCIRTLPRFVAATVRRTRETSRLALAEASAPLIGYSPWHAWSRAGSPQRSPVEAEQFREIAIQPPVVHGSQDPLPQLRQCD